MSWPKPSVQGNRNSASAGRAAPTGGTPDTSKEIGQPNMPPRRTWLTFAVILLVNYFLVRFLFPGPDAALTVPYTVFKEEVAKGNVQSIYSQGASIEGRFAAPVTWPPRRPRRTPPRTLQRPVADSCRKCTPSRAPRAPSPPRCPRSSIPASRRS